MMKVTSNPSAQQPGDVAATSAANTPSSATSAVAYDRGGSLLAGASPSAASDAASSASQPYQQQIDDLLASATESAASAAAPAPPGPMGTPYAPSSPTLSTQLGAYLFAHKDAEAINIGDGRVAVFDKDGDTSGFAIYAANGNQIAPPPPGMQAIDPNINKGLGSLSLGGGNYLNFDLNGITVDATKKVSGTALGYDASGTIAVGTSTDAATGTSAPAITPSTSSSSAAQGTPYVKTQAAPGTDLANYFALNPDAQAVNVGDGRVAVFDKDNNKPEFGLFDANGKKIAPAGSGLQQIKTNDNGGIGSMVLSASAYLNFDANGITVDPAIKNQGTPLGYDASGKIGVGVGTANELTEDANPFYTGGGILGASSVSNVGALYPSGTPSASDVNQRGIGDCYFDSAIASLAQSPQGQTAIKNSIQQISTDPPLYAVKMFDPDGKPITVTVNAAGDDSGVVGADGKTDWASVLEQAWTKYNDTYHTNSQSSGTAGIQGGPANRVFLSLLGDLNTGYNQLSSPSSQSESSQDLGQTLARQLAEGQAITAGTKSSASNTVGTTAAGTPILTDHDYSVVSVDTANNTITLRNPWGSASSNDPADPNQGIITMSLDDFRRLFSSVSSSGK